MTKLPARGRNPESSAPDLQFLAESIPHIAWMASPNGSTEYVNRQGTEYMGVPADANDGWDWVDLVHPQEAERARRAWDYATQTSTPFVAEYRIRRADGVYRWHALRSLPVRGADDQVVAWVGTATDIEDQKELEVQLRQAEQDTTETLILLETLQSAAPVGLGFVDRALRIFRLNETLAGINGAPLEEQRGRRVAEVIPDIWNQAREAYRQVLGGGDAVVNLEVTGHTAADPGAVHHWLASFYPVSLADVIVGVGLVVLDVTERKRADAALAASEARFREFLADIDLGAVMLDASGMVLFINDHLLTVLERKREDVLGRNWIDLVIPEPARDGRRRAFLEAIASGSLTGSRENGVVTASGELRQLSSTSVVQRDARGKVIGLASIASDVTAVRRLEAEGLLLATAIEQTSESVMIADLDARITYVNPSFERVTGYTREEVIGQNPRILSSGLQPRSFYEAMWASLTAGDPWVADFINRRKDGSTFAEEAVISPIRDKAGVVTSYVAVKRDVTHERNLEQQSAQVARERALIADTIRGLRSDDTPEATAEAICHQVVSLAGVAASQICFFDLDGRAVPIGFVVPGHPDAPLRRLPYQRSRHLRDRAAEGPWIEPWVNRPWHPYNQLLNDLGIRSGAYAPVRYDGRLIGVLSIHATEPVDGAAITEALPGLVEFADLAGALCGRAVVERTNVRRARDQIQTIIDRHAFRPVFQPIVDLERDVIVGYEALTRFADGVAPDVRFDEAIVVGLGIELEAATLRAALADASHLPRSAWLNVNVSPEFIVEGEPLRTLVRATRRHLVLEVTEHREIADYPAFRAAIAELGRRTELAVDDAGAGFASLRHILELRPAFVKLDRWLVAGLEADEARQAMIVGMHHFSRATGCQLVAEGVETEAELMILRELEVPLGQGYLLGQPLPIGEGLASVAASRAPDRRGCRSGRT